MGGAARNGKGGAHLALIAALFVAACQGRVPTPCVDGSNLLGCRVRGGVAEEPGEGGVIEEPGEGGVPTDDGTPTGRGGERVVEIAAGGYHSCARTSEGRVYCWGCNSHGQLGDNTFGGRLGAELVRLPGRQTLSGVTSIAAGNQFSCAVSDGRLYCWGYLEGGMLNEPTATAIWPLDGGAGPLVRNEGGLAAGERHLCLVDRGGGVWCGGWNERLQTGQSFRAKSFGPVDAGLGPAVQIAAGGFHTCAVWSGGEVACWGDNNGGQLGNGVRSTMPSALPVRVNLPDAGAPPDPRHVALGAGHSCVEQSGLVWCWGYAANGRLGNSRSSEFQADPVMIESSLTRLTSVAAGAEHTCALQSDAGAVVCWGANRYLQRPSAARFDWEPSPVGDAGYHQVTVGAHHTCALRHDGRVTCWGNNNVVAPSSRVLCDPMVPASSDPVIIGGLPAPP